MNCTNCNAPLHEGERFCKNCGSPVTANAQNENSVQTKASVKNIIVKQFRETVFLVFAICFTVMFASFALSMISSGFIGISSNLLAFIFMLIATIGLWKCYTAKETDDVSKALNQASIYDAYQRVMYTITIVCEVIACIALVCLAIFAGSALSELIATDDAMTGGVLVAVVVAIGFAVVITITALIRSIFKNRRLYFKALSHAAATGEYKETKAPVIGSYILGVYSALGSIFPIVIGALGTTFIDAIFDILSEMADLSEYEAVLESFLTGLVGGLVISGISQLVLGVYYILSALWMSKVHKAIKNENK